VILKHIDRNNTIKAIFLIAFFFLSTILTKAQVYESLNNESYNLLYRFAQKGFINWNDFVLPLDRYACKEALIAVKKNHSDKLTEIEKKEIEFYLSEFLSEFSKSDSLTEHTYILKKDGYNRKRFFYSLNSDASIYIDPIVGFNSSQFSNGKSTTQYFNGLRLWGYLGKLKRIGYNFTFRNVVEKGDSLDFTRGFSQTPGIINTSINKQTEINFTDINVNVAYRFNKGFVSFGRENINIGYGEFGKPILSSKSPSFINIRLNYRPFKWLQFDFFHGWLNSNILDSNLSYLNQGYVREIFTPKFIASHAFTLKPNDKISFSLGESMVYSDKFDIGYVLPINFFKSYDTHVSNYRLPAGSNNQFYLQLSLRNYFKNTHLYGSLFIDEIRLATVFNSKKERNQLGYNLGVNITDFFVHYLSVGTEYTRIRGGVYNNIIAAQTYTNSNFSLGDWMGQNADRLGIYLKYKPKAKLKFNVWNTFIRKARELTVQEQYDETTPSTSFMNEKLFSQNNFGLSIHYELIQTLKCFATIERVKRTYVTNNQLSRNTNFCLGISYGF